MTKTESFSVIFSIMLRDADAAAAGYPSGEPVAVALREHASGDSAALDALHLQLDPNVGHVAIHDNDSDTTIYEWSRSHGVIFPPEHEGPALHQAALRRPKGSC